jgi:hypothetical protein
MMIQKHIVADYQNQKVYALKYSYTFDNLLFLNIYFTTKVVVLVMVLGNCSGMHINKIQRLLF